MSAVGVDPRVTGAQALLGRRRAPRDAPRRLRALAAPARARDRASTPRRCRTDCVALVPEDVADLGPLRLPGARPAGARRRRAPRRRRRRGGRRAHRARPARAAAAADRGRLRGAARRLRRGRGGRARGAAAASRRRRRRRGEAVSIGVRPLPGTNVCHRFRLVTGDVAAGFDAADVVVEEAFRTASAAHVPMEPHAALAEWEDGRLTVWAGTQTPFNTRADLAGLFGLERRATCASSRRRWAARSAPRRSCAPRRSSPRSRARRGGR